MNLVIGDELDREFFRINRELRVSTMEKHSRAISKTVDYYNPWACGLSIYGDDLLNDLLVNEPVGFRGEVITDRDYLNIIFKCWGSVQEFDRVKKSESAVANCLHGDVIMWLPDINVTETDCNLFYKGRDLLRSAWPGVDHLYDELIDFVISINKSNEIYRRGYCTHAARGVLFREINPKMTDWDVAIDLANGLAHQVLYVWQSVDPLLRSPLDAKIFSYNKNKIKPAIQYFHEVVALGFMYKFSKNTNFESNCLSFSRHGSLRRVDGVADALKISLGILLSSCKFTDIGCKIVDELKMLSK